MKRITGLLIFIFVCQVSQGQEEEADGVFISRKGVHIINKQSQHVMVCNKTEDVDDKLEWVNPAGNVVRGRAPQNRVFVEHLRNRVELVLIINLAEEADAGNWTCRAGDKSDTVQVEIVEEATFAKDPDEEKPVEEKQHRSAKLKCIAQGTPTPELQWQKDDRPINITEEFGRKYDQKNSTSGKWVILNLRILALEPEDSGEYTCRALQISNHWSHEAKTTRKLKVLHAPIRQHESSTVEVFGVVGESKNIECVVSAYPTPTFEWVRKYKKHQQRIPEERITQEEDDGFITSILTVQLFDEKDFGTYVCKAHNDHGFTDTQFQLSVGNKPEPPINISLFEATSSNLTFYVEVDNDTQAELPIKGVVFQLLRWELDDTNTSKTPTEWGNETGLLTEIELDRDENNTYTITDLPDKATFWVRVKNWNDATYSDWANITITVETAGAALLFPSGWLVLFLLLHVWLAANFHD